MTGIGIIAIHILFTGCLFLLMKAGRLKADRGLLPVMFLVPLWGDICALLMHREAVQGRLGSQNHMLEVMRRRHESRWELPVETGEPENIVPLEDALLINESDVRRSLILDVLMEGGAGNYIPILSQARMNEDVEVVHYASTAMAELFKDYDLQLQQLEARYRRNPEDEELLWVYADFLEEFIGNNMAQGQFMEIQKSQYRKLLEEKIRKRGRREDYEKLAQAAMEGKDFLQASQVLEAMEKRWPRDCQLWLLKLQYAFRQNQGERIQSLIHEIEEKEIYLPAEGKELLQFWKKERTG